MSPQFQGHRPAPLQTLAARLATCLCAALAAAPLLASLIAPGAAFAAERVVGSGRLVAEARNVGEFEAIALRGSFDVVVRQGSATSLSITADDNLLPLIEAVVEPGASSGGPRLTLRWKPGVSLTTKSKTQVLVVTPRLVAVASSGSGDLRVESFSTPSLVLSLSGSGDAALPGLKTDELRIGIAGSGDVKTEGEASRLKVNIAGSGDVLAKDLRVMEAVVSIAGSGDVAVQVQKKLTVSIAGSGNVTYSGEPEVTRSVAGSGTIKRR